MPAAVVLPQANAHLGHQVQYVRTPTHLTVRAVTLRCESWTIMPLVGLQPMAAVVRANNL